jgi:hypothetical protein
MPNLTSTSLQALLLMAAEIGAEDDAKVRMPTNTHKSEQKSQMVSII